MRGEGVQEAQSCLVELCVLGDIQNWGEDGVCVRGECGGDVCVRGECEDGWGGSYWSH